MPFFTASKKVNSETSSQQDKGQDHSSTPASPTFLKDPVRNSNVPDAVGKFYDPMSTRATYTQGIDPTNTGA
ncbi:hypothetical protein BDA99DRAFT_522371 [Phascolomyces articulosus]|uniref:Uncharacterized protein n=1 Tax=Phascolomyces articulosus TaxID=60185 RepID=A0AAD5K143_9FUNG|nr:hypothetical protein BDA99DRAFT_522371 [Phascolomyces articulosus]